MAQSDGISQDVRGWFYRINRRIYGQKIREIGRERFPQREMAQAAYTQRLQELWTQSPTVRQQHPETRDLQSVVTQWLEEVVRPSRSPKTYATYCYNLQPIAHDPLGSLPVGTITPLAIQDFLTRQLAQKSPTNVRRTFDKLRQVFHQMQLWKMRTDDPTQGITAPPMHYGPRPTMTVDEAQHLLAVTADHQFYMVEVLGLWAGLRRGEILGLRWEDIDWTEGTVTIRRQAVLVNGKRVDQDRLKTATGYRTVDLPQRCLDALREHQQRQHLLQQRLGDAWHGQGYIIVQANGTPPNPNWVRQALKRAHRKQHLPEITIHDLRHAHATHLLEAGANIKDVADRLGHANIQVTLDIYAHVTRGRQRHVAQLVDQVFEGKS